MTESLSLSRACAGWLAAGEPVALVSVAVAKGSTPRESGARMLVRERTSLGTIGGGRLEFEAIAEARRMLAGGDAQAELLVPLGPEIGQCCGGHVALRLRRMDSAALAELSAAEAAEAEILPRVLLFGAGHASLMV
jgi:xanthine dehydrogenase accessory factor